MDTFEAEETEPRPALTVVDGFDFKTMRKVGSHENHFPFQDNVYLIPLDRTQVTFDAVALYTVRRYQTL